MTPTEFCVLVENRLGWRPPQGPQWRRYQAQARQVASLIALNPELYTERNLRLAVELLAREKKQRSPVWVLSHVERALDLALDPEHEVEHEIFKAVSHEVMAGDPDGWVVRFSRASGGFRKQLLDEWRSSRGEEVEL